MIMKRIRAQKNDEDHVSCSVYRYVILTATKGSFPRRPKTNQDVPQRNTNKDKKKGMNSTLFVLITNLYNYYLQVKDSMSKKTHKKTELITIIMS